MSCLCFWRQALFFIKCPNYLSLHWSRVCSFAKKAISGFRLSEWGEHQQLQRSPFEWSVQNLLWFPLVYSEQSFQSFRQLGQSSCYRKYNCSPFQIQLGSLQSFNRKLRAICFVIVMLEKSTLLWTTVQPDFIGQVAFISLFLYWNVNFEALTFALETEILAQELNSSSVCDWQLSSR